MIYGFSFNSTIDRFRSLHSEIIEEFQCIEYDSLPQRKVPGDDQEGGRLVPGRRSPQPRLHFPQREGEQRRLHGRAPERFRRADRVLREARVPEPRDDEDV